MSANGPFDELITFFKNHQNLSRLYLHLDSYGRSTDIQATVDLTTNLPNLVELKLVGFQPVGIELVNQIIQSHEKIMSIQFSAGNIQLEKFHEQFGNEWNMKKLGYMYVFEKRIRNSFEESSIFDYESNVDKIEEKKTK